MTMRRLCQGLCCHAVVAGLLAAQALAAEPVDPLVAEVKARDAELSAAHGRGDVDAYLKGLSQRYVYVDMSGNRVTADRLASRRSNDQLRQVASEIQEEEGIRISDTVVLLRGLERGSFTYFGGLPRQGTTRWTALWAREDDGQWRLVSETATPVVRDGGLPFTEARQAAASVRARQGRWALALPQPLVLALAAERGRLVATIPGQSMRVTFAPASATHYYALERPFELRFGSDGQSLTLVTWGTETKGRLAGAPR